MGDKIHNAKPIKIEGHTHVEESVYKEVRREEKGSKGMEKQKGNSGLRDYGTAKNSEDT